MNSINREFGTVMLGEKSVADLVVSEGWAKVICCVEVNYFKFFVIFFALDVLTLLLAGQGTDPAEGRGKSLSC